MKLYSRVVDCSFNFPVSSSISLDEFAERFGKELTDIFDPNSFKVTGDGYGGYSFVAKYNNREYSGKASLTQEGSQEDLKAGIQIYFENGFPESFKERLSSLPKRIFQGEIEND